jgi:hypothetical protein
LTSTAALQHTQLQARSSITNHHVGHQLWQRATTLHRCHAHLPQLDHRGIRHQPSSTQGCPSRNAIKKQAQRETACHAGYPSVYLVQV